MPEMNNKVVNTYLDLIVNKNLNLFLNFKHETKSNHKNKKQVFAREAVKNKNKLKLLIRNDTSMKNGYLKEIYNCNN